MKHQSLCLFTYRYVLTNGRLKPKDLMLNEQWWTNLVQELLRTRTWSDLRTHQVVDDVGQSPHHGNAEEGYAEEHDVENPDPEGIGQPDAPTVHHPGVWVHLTVCHTHVHPGLWAENRQTKKT